MEDPNIEPGAELETEAQPTTTPEVPAEPVEPAEPMYTEAQVQMMLLQAQQASQPAPVATFDEFSDLEEAFYDSNRGGPQAVFKKMLQMAEERAEQRITEKFGQQFQQIAARDVLDDLSGGDQGARDYLRSTFGDDIANLRNVDPKLKEVFRLASKQASQEKASRNGSASPAYSEPAPRISTAMQQEIAEMEAMTGIKVSPEMLRGLI